MTADDLIRILKLRPHPREGGFYRETYRSDDVFPAEAMHSRFNAPRCYSTAIYFLLKAGSFSEMHRLQSDDVEQVTVSVSNGAYQTVGRPFEIRNDPQVDANVRERPAKYRQARAHEERLEEIGRREPGDRHVGVDHGEGAEKDDRRPVLEGARRARGHGFFTKTTFMLGPGPVGPPSV